MANVIHIQEYIKERKEKGEGLPEIAASMGISNSMLHYYYKGYNIPSLKTAVGFYNKLGVTFHPYSEDSLKWEIK